METRVQLDPATGTATITPATSLPPGQNLRFALFDARAKRYLTTSGWASGRKTLVEVTPDGSAADIVLNAATAAHLKPGTPLVLEEIFVGIRESFVWPKPPAPLPASEPAPAAPVVLAPVLAEPPSVEPPQSGEEAAMPHPRPTRKRSGVDIAAGILLGLLVGLAIGWTMIRIAPDTAPAREVLTLTTERDQLRKDAQSAQQQVTDQRAEKAAAEARVGELDKAVQARDGQIQSLRAQLSARPAAPTSAPSAANQALTQQIESLKADNARLQSRTSEQEKLIASRDGEISSLKSQLETRPEPVPIVSPIPTARPGRLEAELQDAQRVAADLRQENLQLQERMQNQSQTIAVWGAERTTTANRIKELEQQLALRTANTPAAPAPATSALWLAAAVNAAGSVEFVTGFDSEEAATAAVMQKCRQTRRSCEIIGTFRNMCFSVARPKGQAIMQANYWFQYAEDRTAAQRAAIRDCDRNSGGYCATAFTVCADEK